MPAQGVEKIPEGKRSVEETQAVRFAVKGRKSAHNRPAIDSAPIWGCYKCAYIV